MSVHEARWSVFEVAIAITVAFAPLALHSIGRVSHDEAVLGVLSLMLVTLLVISMEVGR